VPGTPFNIKYFKYHMATNGSGNVIEWAVEGDSKIVRYEVQRSSDQSSWVLIGTTTPSVFNYLDKFPSTTICVKKFLWWCTQKKTVYTPTHYYYRLRAVDSDLNSYFSIIIKT